MSVNAEEMISVIVPVYNAENYLDRCLTSLTEQTYQRLEILLINDGSQDGSAEICRKWCEQDTRIRVLSQENQGVSAARNLGLEQAKGDYIAFVDADDWILPDMLEKQLRCLEQEQSDMVLGGFREVNEAYLNEKTDNSNEKQKDSDKTQNGQKIRNNLTTVDARTYAGQYLLRGNNRCWSVLYKKDTIGPVRFIRGLTIGEDLLFLMDLLPRIKSVSILKDQDYCYFINEKGAMLTEFREKYMDQISCWEQAEEKMKPLWPENLPLIRVCLFQAALLVAGKLAQLPDLRDEKVTGYLNRCLDAARKSWKALGAEGRKLLSKGYQVKGLVFLHAPKLYLKMYHIWKGLR